MKTSEVLKIQIVKLATRLYMKESYNNPHNPCYITSDLIIDLDAKTVAFTTMNSGSPSKENLSFYEIGVDFDNE